MAGTHPVPPCVGSYRSSRRLGLRFTDRREVVCVYSAAKSRYKTPVWALTDGGWCVSASKKWTTVSMCLRKWRGSL
jgi:hypothetical protein